jgi:hypothetical protein
MGAPVTHPHKEEKVELLLWQGSRHVLPAGWL